MQLILGFTGSIGSGCTTAAQHLRKSGFEYISISSDILSPLAADKDVPFDTPVEKQDAGNLIRSQHSGEYLRSLVASVEAKKSKDISIECFRNPEEIERLRSLYPQFFLIALYAGFEDRQLRKPIEGFKDIDERDKGEEVKFGQQVSKCVDEADIVLDNSHEWTNRDEAEEFFYKLETHVKLLREPFRGPTPDELAMHLAYSTSLLSDCIGRQVGAVITDQNYRVLSAGYNCPPQGSETCLDLFDECFRKKKKREGLFKYAASIKACPLCGKRFLGAINPSNGMLKCPSCKEDLGKLFSPGKELDYCRALHAEENAILSNPYTADLFYKKDKELLMFTSTFPCMLCAKKIANSGIKRVMFVEPYPVIEALQVLDENSVQIRAFEGVKSLRFNWIFRKRNEYVEKQAALQKKELARIKGGMT